MIFIPFVAMIAAAWLLVAMSGILRSFVEAKPGRHFVDVRARRWRRRRIGETCDHAGMCATACQYCDGTSIVLYPRGLGLPMLAPTSAGGTTGPGRPAAPLAHQTGGTQ